MPPAAVAAASPAARVPYLAKPQVRRAAAVLLAEYGAARGPVLVPPVPVDEILELHLGLTFEIADLRARFGVADVLGAIWFADRVVRVDAGLDPKIDPRRLGRYRFTLAHEAAHWVLHRRHFLAAGHGADGEDGPAHVCRSGGSKEPVEWQADYFAGHLLMPSELVRSVWEAWRGSLCPAGPAEVSRAAEGGADPVAAARRFVRPLADRFEVSGDAMRIRLEELGLLASESTEQRF